RFLIVCVGPCLIPLLLLKNSPIVIGARVIGFEFYRSGVISNSAITVVSLCPDVGAIVVSGRICRAELNRFGVVGDGARTVILHPFCLGTVIIWRVIFWIDLSRAVKISDSTVQVAVLCLFDPAVNQIAIGLIRPAGSRR